MRIIASSARMHLLCLRDESCFYSRTERIHRFTLSISVDIPSLPIYRWARYSSYSDQIADLVTQNDHINQANKRSREYRLLAVAQPQKPSEVFHVAAAEHGTDARLRNRYSYCALLRYATYRRHDLSDVEGARNWRVRGARDGCYQRSKAKELFAFPFR